MSADVYSTLTFAPDRPFDYHCVITIEVIPIA